LAQYFPACRAVGAHEGARVGFGQSCFLIPLLRAGAGRAVARACEGTPAYIEPCIHLEAAEKVSVAASSARVLLAPA